jgi:hypothetical protein
MDEAFHESAEEADEEEIREILERKHGRMLPDRVFFGMVVPILVEINEGRQNSAHDEVTKKTVTNDVVPKEPLNDSQDVEVFDPSDRSSLEKLKSLPQPVKDIVDDFVKKPPRDGNSVLRTVMKKMNCPMPSNFRTLIANYLALEVKKKRKKASKTATSTIPNNPDANTSNLAPNPQDEASSNSGKKTNVASPARNPPGYSSEELPYTKCLQCQTQVVSDDNAMKCFRCASFLHQECGTTYKPLEDHDADETILCCCKKCASTETITLCTNCAVQLKANSHRLRVKPTNDFNLGVSFSQKLVRKRGNETHLGIPKPKKPKLSAAEEEQERLEKAVQLQHWLTGIVSVKYMKLSKKYVVKSMNNAHEEQKTLDGGFVDDSILLNNKAFKLKVKTERAYFHDVSDVVKENVVLRYKLWSGPMELYKTYQDCMTGKMWSQIKINYKGGKGKESADISRLELVETKGKLTAPTKQYYISLRGREQKDKSRDEVEYVPEYFLFLWRVQIGAEEMDRIMTSAGRRRNKWTNIPEGRSSFGFGIPKDLQTFAFENKFLQHQDPTCVVTSLANAFMYINDANAAYTLMRNKELSLQTNRRLQFVANLMHSMNYKVTRLSDFDILTNTSKWPTVCGLLGSDGGMTHAVAVCGEVLFDGNVTFALVLNRENLNWCCGAEGVAVEYVKVHLGYRFEFTKNVPKHFKHV